MRLSRRDFLKWASLSAVGAVACDIFREGERDIQSPLEMPEDLVTGQDNWYASLCYQCPEREGIIVRVMEGRAKKVRGNPVYPTNRGKQSARCEAGLQTLYHPDRLSKPMVLREGAARGSGDFHPIEWNDAMNRLRGRLKGLQDGNNTSGMLMITEPLSGHLGMVVNRFVESYGGRRLALQPLDQTALRAAVKRVFNQDILPNFDIENSRYLISFGADFLSTWVSPVRYARGFGEFRHGEGEERGTFVHVDPRYSMTAANADRWIPIDPGKEGILALSMAYVIMSEGLADPGVVADMTGAAGPSALDNFKPDNIVDSNNELFIGVPEKIGGKPAADVIREIALEFAGKRPRSLAIGGGEAGAHTNGLFNLSAIFALNYLVGSVGTKGGIIFNPPPPEELELPPPPTSGSLVDWLRAADDIRTGKIKLLMVNGANPVHGFPERAGFREALEAGDPFVVSFSSFMDDTTQMADLVLPERIYLEEWGDDVPEPGPGYQVVGIQQPVVNPLPELDPRSFPDLLLTLSQELGLEDGLPNTFRDALRQGAQKLYDLKRGGPLGEPSETPTFEAFWNKLLERGGWHDERTLSTDTPPAPPNLAELAQGDIMPSFRSPRVQTELESSVFYLVPFLSNSLLDGRGAHLPWLQAAPDPLTTITWQTWIEINSAQAREMGLKEGDVVNVISTEETMEAIVYPHPAVPPGLVSIPVGQGHTPGLQYATKEGQRRGANPVSILAPEQEKETQELAWAATRVLIQPTGRNTRVSKFEGIVTAFPIGTRDEDIVQVTRG